MKPILSLIQGLLIIAVTFAVKAPFPVILGGSTGTTVAFMCDYYAPTQNIAATGYMHDYLVKGYGSSNAEYNMFVASFQGPG